MTSSHHLTNLARLRDNSRKARGSYERAVVAAIRNGETYRAVAAALGVSIGTVQTIVRKHRRGL